MFQLANPVTEWTANGEAASCALTAKRRKGLPLGMVTAQDVQLVDRMGGAFHPRGVLSYSTITREV